MREVSRTAYRIAVFVIVVTFAYPPLKYSYLWWAEYWDVSVRFWQCTGC